VSRFRISALCHIDKVVLAKVIAVWNGEPYLAISLATSIKNRCGIDEFLRGIVIEAQLCLLLISRIGDSNCSVLIAISNSSLCNLTLIWSIALYFCRTNRAKVHISYIVPLRLTSH